MNYVTINGSPVYLIPTPKGWRLMGRLAGMTAKERRKLHHTRAEWRRIYNGYLKTGACRCTWDQFINRRRRAGFVLPTKKGSWK